MFLKDYPKKPTASSLPLDSALYIAKPTSQSVTKQKQEQLAKNLPKEAKK